MVCAFASLSFAKQRFYGEGVGQLDISPTYLSGGVRVGLEEAFGQFDARFGVKLAQWSGAIFPNFELDLIFPLEPLKMELLNPYFGVGANVSLISGTAGFGADIFAGNYLSIESGLGLITEASVVAASSGIDFNFTIGARYYF